MSSPDQPEPGAEPRATLAELLSLAVHELRTPLSVVGGYIKMVQKFGEGPRPEREAKMLEEAEKVCDRLAAVITEMSDLSKLEGGTLAMQSQDVDVFAILAQAVARSTEGKDRGVLLEFRGETRGAVIRADHVRVESALDALLRSVLRERIRPCTVVAECRLGSGPSGRSAVIVISDAAHAAAAGTAERRPFNERRGGLGMQLPIARRIVEHYGGELWSTDAGATVLRIPLGSDAPNE